MAEVLLAFAEPVVSEEGVAYLARACGAPSGHTWQGWIEFIPAEGGTAVRSGRETTQPNRDDLVYWASGVTHVYLEGSLRRALKPLTRPTAATLGTPIYDGPAPAPIATEMAPAADSVLNPLSVYRKGEALLRKQLAALSSWHLVNIVRDYRLSALEPGVLSQMSAPDLIDLIVTSTRERDGIARRRLEPSS